jgi:hypothetical protein
MSEQNPFLNDEQIERLLTSFIKARHRQGREASEEECHQLLQWAILACVNHTSLMMCLEGELEIDEFDNNDIQFIRAESLEYHTPLMTSIMEQLEDKFDGG